jgi:hypothetical protein
VDCSSPLNPPENSHGCRKTAAIGYRQEPMGDSGNRSCRSSRPSEIGMLAAWILS